MMMMIMMIMMMMMMMMIMIMMMPALQHLKIDANLKFGATFHSFLLLCSKNETEK